MEMRVDGTAIGTPAEIAEFLKNMENIPSLSLIKNIPSISLSKDTLSIFGSLDDKKENLPTAEEFQKTKASIEKKEIAKKSKKDPIYHPRKNKDFTNVEKDGILVDYKTLISKELKGKKAKAYKQKIAREWGRGGKLGYRAIDNLIYRLIEKDPARVQRIMGDNIFNQMLIKRGI